MPRHLKRRHAGRRAAPRAARAAVEIDPVARLRPLILEGIITAAALAARDDLTLAAASMERLGSLTSGMWRALSRELFTASDRLDGQVVERLADLERRAQALQVDASAVLAAGAAASHLEEHRFTFNELLADLEDEAGRRLAASDVLFGFAVDSPLLPLDDADADIVSPLTLQLWLFLWPAPLTPARVDIVPGLSDPTATKPEVPLGIKIDVAESLVDALAVTLSLPGERIPPLLSTLALVCFTAHQMDERAEEIEDDEDEDEDDDDGDDAG